MDNISRDEWLKALGDAVAPLDPDAHTVTELARMFKVSRSTMEDHVRRLVEQGAAVRTVKHALDINGTAKRVTAYRLLVKAPAAPPMRKRVRR